MCACVLVCDMYVSLAMLVEVKEQLLGGGFLLLVYVPGRQSSDQWCVAKAFYCSAVSPTP